MFAIWNRCQEAINAARITCNSTQHITGCGARCTTGGHDAVMSGEDSTTQVGVGTRGRGRGFRSDDDNCVARNGDDDGLGP